MKEGNVLYRDISRQLMQWKNENWMKPCLLTGMKGVGKTTYIKEFAQEHFPHTVYFDLTDEKSCDYIFSGILKKEDVEKRIENPKETLIILDHAEVEKIGINKSKDILKFIQANLKDYYICFVADVDSLQLFEPAQIVGLFKVEMFPISIKEFMVINNDEFLAEKIEQGEELEAVELDKIRKYIKVYFVTGGMPHTLYIYMSTRKLDSVYKAGEDVLENINMSFEQLKDVKFQNIVRKTFYSVAEELAKEDKYYSLLEKKGYFERKKYIKAIDWLIDHKLIVKVDTVESEKMQPSKQEKKFQLFYQDIGILTRICGIGFEELIPFDYPYKLKSGALFFQFIMEQMIHTGTIRPCCPAKSMNLNCNYICESSNEIISVFVDCKDGKNDLKNSIGTAVEITEDTLEITEDILKIPSFAVWNLW